MKPLIVRTDPDVRIAEELVGELQRVAEVVTSASDHEDAIISAARRASVIMTCYAPITARIIKSAPLLKGIVKYGVGVDSIDLPAATECNVMVANCPDYGSNTVADQAFALLMCLARRLVLINNTMRGAGWCWPSSPYLGTDITGKRLGLIGLGRIGTAMARRAAGFGMSVAAYDPYVAEDVFRANAVEQSSLAELLAESDFVSVHCVLTPETFGMIGEQELRRMKPAAYLVNVSRGAIVDEQALIRALREGWIRGLGCDVFANEPLPPGFPLAGMENVILTPHLAWYTKEAVKRVDRDTVDAVIDILHGKLPKHLKNREVLSQPEPASA